MRLSEIMTTRLISITRKDNVLRAYQILEKLPIHHILVVEEGQLLGIISDRDVLRHVSPYLNTPHESKRDKERMLEPAENIMTQNPITISVSSAIREAAKLMVKNNISLLPVVDSTNTLIGVISWKDVLRYLAE